MLPSPACGERLGKRWDGRVWVIRLRLGGPFSYLGVLVTGLRIRCLEDGAANAVVEVRDESRRLPDGSPKRYYLQFDDQSCAIVSSAVWESLRRIMGVSGAGVPWFCLVGSVADPPTQRVGASDLPALPVLRMSNGLLALSGLSVQRTY